MTDDPKTGGWWQTLPGVLTAVAGTLTATAGLVVALHQAGLLGTPGDRSRALGAALGTSSPQLAQATAGLPPGREPADPRSAGTAGPAAGDFPRALAITGQQVRLGDAVFRVLSAEVDRLAPGRLELRFVVRATNDAPSHHLTVSAASFRLLVDSVPQAPADALDTYVPPSSAQQGKVTFVFDDTAREVELLFRLTNGEAQRAIPVDLAPRPAGR